MQTDVTPRLTFSIIVEADNVGSSDSETLRACLTSLAAQPSLAHAQGVHLVAGRELPDATGEALRADYPWLSVIQPGSETYVGMKAAGVSASPSDVVILCDSDMQYEPGWLDALLQGFADEPTAQIVCGETETPIRGPYSLAVALTFNFPRFSGEDRLVPAPMYWANNVAFRRALLAAAPIPDPPELYRGQNIMHGLEVGAMGLTIWRQPAARGHHLVPPVSTVLQRYVALGRDAGALARLTANDVRAAAQVMAPDRIGASQVGKFLGRLRQVVRANPTDALWLPLAAPVVAVLVACYVAGRLAGRRGRPDAHGSH